MKNRNSPQLITRVGGLLYLLIIITGLLGQLFVRDSILAEDASLTYNNLMGSIQLWRWGIAGDILMHILDIPLMVILYYLLRPVNRYLALLGVLFNVIQTAILATNKLMLLLPLVIRENEAFINSFDISQIEVIIQLSIEIHNYGFGLGLIFFGLACLVYGYLLFKSNYFPKFIGVFICLAGICYLINSGALFFASNPPDELFLILLIPFIAELTLALWLLLKGVDHKKWFKMLLKNTSHN